MAEIKIEKKKPVWPWILLIIVILAIIAYLVYENQNDDDYIDDVDSEQIDDVDTYENNDSIYDSSDNSYGNSNNAVMKYSEVLMDSSRVGTDSTLTKSILQKFADAVVYKAEQYNIASSTPLKTLRDFSDGMNSLDGNQNLMQTTKNVTSNATMILETIQTKQFPDMRMQITELKTLSDKINSTAVLQKQKNNLNLFFGKANDILKNMNS